MAGPATKKATREAVDSLKHQGKAAGEQAGQIAGGDDYDPTSQPPEGGPTPEPEPTMKLNQPQLKATAPSARGGGGRGSGGGGGGVMLKNRRLMGPAALATPDYDFKMFNEGGMVKHGSATRVSCKGK
jgi:hypothetical protein